ncbi:hypothetical protein AK830_g1157 [Neonectria ditissima]|uniref:Uncharacterized protein n=1 Tax=Neonectria ditissima TaxID=78410 RepID=A0A0P7BNI2_9HYPO|nr:hypothetical protein AK830_g1157 [Neonectria ditissima]
MVLWPFRRRSGRKRPRSGAALSDAEGGPPISPTEGNKLSSKKKRRTEPPRPLRPARTYSFEPGQQDSLRIDGDRRALRAHDRSGLRNNTNAWDEGDAGAWDRTPTLHNKHRSHHPTRRKDAKKREAEIKAMSNFTPVRPAAEPWTAGRPMKKDSKKAKTSSFGRHGETRTSDVSLPAPGSIHSSLSSDSEMGSYTLSALDALAPRPTLRLAQCPRISPPPPPAHLQPASHRRRLADREPLPEATLKAHKRVDSLADDLDASDLRELMERDNRRREKRKQKEQLRMERRLAKRAEEQKAEVLESRKTGTPPPENLERGVVGRELAGLGIEPASAVVTSSKQRNSNESEAIVDAGTDAVEEPSKKPLEVFHRTDTMPAEEEPTPMEVDTPREGSTITRPSEEHPSSLYSTRLAGILRSVKSRSKSTLRSERDKMVSPPPDTIDEEPRRGSRDSNSSTKTARFSIRALFRFGSRRRRNSNPNTAPNSGPNSGPSSFSNTSREEMQAIAAAVRSKAQAQARALARLEGEDLYTGNYLARKPSSSVPKRTRSRFREDLPELPISPPASRVQSPEPEPPVPALPQSKIDEIESTQSMGVRYETPTSGHRSIEAQHRTPSSRERAYATPSPEAQMSTSLASIDSEGSWMSGKKDARRVALRNSLRRANRQEQGNSISDTPTNSTEEDLAITEDEYLSKLTPRRSPSHKEMGHRSEEARPSSDEEDLVDNSDMKWGAVGSQPQVIHNRATIKSVEGLLDIESENEDSESSPISPVSRSSELADVQRAKSVHLGKGHVRNFSAGSAKLLEITPRLSADRRASTERRSSNAMVM